MGADSGWERTGDKTGDFKLRARGGEGDHLCELKTYVPQNVNKTYMFYTLAFLKKQLKSN